MNKATSRRALLQVGALSGVVAASGLALPALARDTKKTGAEETVSPPEDLMREHAVLERMLLIYDAGMRRLGQGEDIDPAVFEPCRRDRARLHPRLSREDRRRSRSSRASRRPAAWSSWSTCWSVQHAAGRKLTERILAAAPQSPQSRAARGDGSRHPGLHHHVSPACRARGRPTCSRPCASLVTPTNTRSIGRRAGEARDARRSAPTASRRSPRRSPRSRSVIGIHDLDVFTPKSS